jgi:hypothetical protein
MPTAVLSRMSVITKPQEHETNRAGKLLLRQSLESLGWVVNDVQEDYGIDTNIQVFDGSAPTGAWFHVQLKSSAVTAYSSAEDFISQELSVEHARHYALEMRQPILLIHADVVAKRLFWHAPQLDRDLIVALRQTNAKSVVVRIPTYQDLPKTAAGLLKRLEKIHLALANRTLTSSTVWSFAESLKYLPDQEALYRAFQEKGGVLKLQKLVELYQHKKFDELIPRAHAILSDPDSTVEVKFWAEMQLFAVEHTQWAHAGKPQLLLPKIDLAHARRLQQLTAKGPKHLKFHALIARQAAEMEMLVHENYGLFLALQQHNQASGNPMMVLGIYARRSALTRRIVAKYNRCVRLARYAATYPHRWALGRGLTEIVKATGPYIITLRAEGNNEAAETIVGSALQISKLAAWISQETGDLQGVTLSVIAALSTVQSQQSVTYRWASETAQAISDLTVRVDTLGCIERAAKRWRGEHVAGDYHGNVVWQVIQNMASALGVDLTNEDDPVVRALKIAAKDDNPEEVLKNCEHLLVSLGATGPIARRIRRQFNLETAGSKVVHCILHNHHVEGKELDAAYGDFKRLHCDSCPDKKPRDSGWKYTGNMRLDIEAKTTILVQGLAGTQYGYRLTKED